MPFVNKEFYESSYGGYVPSMDHLICVQCGKRFGSHYGLRCELRGPKKTKEQVMKEFPLRPELFD